MGERTDGLEPHQRCKTSGFSAGDGSPGSLEQRGALTYVLQGSLQLSYCEKPESEQGWKRAYQLGG